MTPDDPRHGTANGYNNLGCRCADCREAWRVYYMNQRPCACGNPKHKMRERCHACRTAERRRLAELAPCGTESKYRWGCRCGLCRAAMTEGRKRRRHANPEATRAYDRAYRKRKKAA